MQRSRVEITRWGDSYPITVQKSKDGYGNVVKKKVNNPESLVLEMCNGIAAVYPKLKFDSKYEVLRKKINENKVTLIK